MQNNQNSYYITKMLLMALIEVLLCCLIFLFDIPNPNIILFVVLSAAVVELGYPAGILCGAIALLYSMFYFSVDHSWFSFTPENQNKMLVVVFGIVANVLIVGRLQNRNRLAAQSIARLEVEKQKAEEVARYSQALQAMSRIYWQVFHVDLQTGMYSQVSTGSVPIHTGMANGDFEKAIYEHTQESFWPQVKEFLNTETLPERLKDTDTIDTEFCTRAETWVSARFIVEKRDEQGTPVQVLFLMQKITERKKRELAYQNQLEETTREAKRANQAKTEFLRRMSHDIRTPLNGIIGLLKIDEDHFDDKELVRLNNQKMTIAANHLLALINDVLEMSKLEDGKSVLTHERICLQDLTQDIVTIIVGRAVEAGLVWDYEKGKANIPFPYIYGSPVHLRQIFLNIYGNCIKYNRPGGRITTIVEASADSETMCTYRWIISDTGIGMSQEFLKQIFEPFSQEKQDARSVYQGTGLGMSIVKNLIDQMGGSIRIESQVDVGSTFYIEIPFEIAPAPEKTENTEQVSSGNIHGLHLMLAEDNDLNAEIAKIMLEDRGASVSVVSDGQKAVELFQNSPEGAYDAILMDIMMPVMDGLEATRTIRALPRPDAGNIPILAMTANAFSEDAKRCLEAEMNAHLTKPLDVEKITKTLAKFCGRRNA